MIELKGKYQREEFLKFISDDFLSDFNRDVRQVNTSGLTSIQKANYLGESKILDLQVFEFFYDGSSNKRVALTKDAFSVMRSSAIFRALAVFKSTDSNDWRFSLLTATPEATEKGKVAVSYSNPKRLSFFLGPNAKVNTPTKFLISKGKVIDFEDLKSRFSIEVVNKEFYKEISNAFTKLVGGMLKLPDSTDKSQTNLEFAVRLIGRIIFCWFLKEKKNENNISLMPKELLSLEAISKHGDYYHNILEPIFFEILNNPIKERIDKFTEKPYSTIPYLNGGLFSPEKDDFYKRGIYQSDFYNNLIIPDEWLKEFFAILETYNFTIDENTSYDEELSIDPEMLGRIFENLLAEINPETGESARKSTGSYYTPRIIVDYMVDESLLLYLKQQTEIQEKKLKAVVSYELTDDDDNPLTLNEREKIVNALEKVKILDPACGSGAFPIGALQKIVFILQQVDPDGSLWFKKQLEKASPEFRKDIEKKFSNKEYDFLRKLGVIRECIYGVDIQPIATEISRLRCFLTLIVDEHIDDNEENRGIKPLPNLDFKFVTANSLIGLPKLDDANKATQQPMIFDDRENIDELKNIRDQYFISSGVEREILKADFFKQQKKLLIDLQKTHGWAGVMKADLTSKLSNWDPFTHNKTDWFDPEWMFGIKEGFDIVIANPPYNAKLSKEEKSYFKNKFESVSKGRQDTAAIFVELAKQIGSLKMQLTYILPYRLFSRKRNHGQFQKYILENFNLNKVIYLGAHIGFSANDEFMILIMSSEVKKNNMVSLAYKPLLNNLNKDQIYSEINQNYFKEMGEVNLNVSRFDQKLLAHTRSGSLSLDEICHIKDGIVPFIREKMISDTKRDERYVKFAGIAGKYTLEKFYFHSLPLYLCYDIEEAKKYIKNVEELRKVQLREREIFLNRKIITSQNSVMLKGTIDDDAIFVSNSLHSTYLRETYSNLFNLEYILALINSSTLNYYHNSIRLKGIDLHPQILISNLKRLPIKDVSKVEQKPLVEIVNKILAITKSSDYIENPVKKGSVKKYEEQIDQMVYKLYGLTEAEIEIVEGIDEK